MNKYAICCKIFSLETRIKRKRSKGARNAKLEARGLYLLSQHSTLEIIKQTVPIFLSQSFAPALQKHPPEHVQVSQPPTFPPFSRPCLLYSWANISETSKSFCRERKGGEGECWIKSISKRIGGGGWELKFDGEAFMFEITARCKYKRGARVAFTRPIEAHWSLLSNQGALFVIKGGQISNVLPLLPLICPLTVYPCPNRSQSMYYISRVDVCIKSADESNRISTPGVCTLQF